MYRNVLWCLSNGMKIELREKVPMSGYSRSAREDDMCACGERAVWINGADVAVCADHVGRR